MKITQQFLGTGKGIVYLGSGCYGGWSGKINITNTSESLFEFHTPNKALKSRFSFFPDYTDLAGGYHAGYELYLNDLLVLESKNENEAGGRSNSDNYFGDISLMIPPNTKVTFKCVTNDGDGCDFSCAYLGREI